MYVSVGNNKLKCQAAVSTKTCLKDQALVLTNTGGCASSEPQVNRMFNMSAKSTFYKSSARLDQNCPNGRETVRMVEALACRTSQIKNPVTPSEISRDAPSCKNSIINPGIPRAMYICHDPLRKSSACRRPCAVRATPEALRSARRGLRSGQGSPPAWSWCRWRAGSCQRASGRVLVAWACPRAGV